MWIIFCIVIKTGGRYMYSIEKIKTDLKDRVSEYRYEHSLMVADEAKKLAKKYNLDEDKAYVTGLVHDIAKEFTHEENAFWVKKYNLSKDLLLESNHKIIHADVGAVYVKEKYGFDDEICMAVRYHTIGNPNMSTFDKIIYIADKIGRKDKDEFIMNLKKIAYEDIDKAVYVFLLHQKEKFDKKNKSLSNSTLELLNLLQDKYSK
jgi:nicotinate-nucleotide adenylyltransferase